MVMSEEEEADIVLGQTAMILDMRGDVETAQLLAEVELLDFESTDDGYTTESNWHDYYWAVVLHVEEQLLPAFSEDVKARIAPVLIEVATRNGHSSVDRMIVRTALPVVEKNWRSGLRERATALPANQARRERAAPAVLAEDGLAFASRQELQVYQALKRLQAETPHDRTIAVAPLPGVRLHAGYTWSPDLLVLGNGRAVVIEVDGPHHRKNRRYVDDRNRDLQWQRCGIAVVRLAVEDLAEDTLDQRLREELKRHLWPR